MFTTAPGLIQHLHPSSVAPLQSHWPAVTLSMERPWYLLVYGVSYQGRKVSQTSLVAWDATLLDMLAQIPVGDLSGIARLDRCHGPGPNWAFRWIDALWAPSPREALSLGPVLFKLGDDPQIRDTRLLPVDNGSGLRLLYEAPRTPPAWG